MHRHPTLLRNLRELREMVNARAATVRASTAEWVKTLSPEAQRLVELIPPDRLYTTKHAPTCDCHKDMNSALLEVYSYAKDGKEVRMIVLLAPMPEWVGTTLYVPPEFLTAVRITDDDEVVELQ